MSGADKTPEAEAENQLWMLLIEYLNRQGVTCYATVGDLAHGIVAFMKRNGWRPK